MEQVNSNQRAQEIEVLKAAAYATVSALISLLGLGGLLIGYYTGGSPAGHAIAGGAPILKGSLLGVVLEIIRGSISAPKAVAAAGIAGYLPLFMYIVVIVLIGVLLLSFMMTIAAILSPRFARGLCLQNGRMLFFCYGLLFLGNLLLNIFTNSETDSAYFDLSSFISAASIWGLLFFASLAENRAKTAANLVLFILSALCVCALMLPNMPLTLAVNGLTFAKRDNLTRYTLMALSVTVLINFVISVVRLGAKRRYPFDIVRFSILFVCAVALVTAYYLDGGAFFPEQPLAAVFLFLGILSGIFFSAFLTVIFGKKKPAPQKQTVRAQIPEIDEETELAKS